MLEQVKYENLVSRNWFYINSVLQNKIRNVNILFAGCGLGSVIAQSAIRLGFENMTIVDGDNVDLTNLNRQFYFQNDVGVNKAKSLKNNLLMINPNANIKSVEKYIKVNDLSKLVSEVDIVINTVDLNNTYYEIITETIKHKKTVICPFNVGFGGVLILFNKNSVGPEIIWGRNLPIDNKEFYMKLIESLKKFHLPLYISKELENLFSEINNKGYQPQISIGGNIIASIVLSTIIKVLQNKDVSLAPCPIFFDSYE